MTSACKQLNHFLERGVFMLNIVIFLFGHTKLIRGLSKVKIVLFYLDMQQQK